VFHSNYPKYSQHKQSFPAAFTYLIFQVQNQVRKMYFLFNFIMGGLLRSRRSRTTLLLCSGRRADDAGIQNPYPQKTDRWDEAGQTTAIVEIPNKHLPCFVLFKLKRSKYA
jgi:hypothetical protein